MMIQTFFNKFDLFAGAPNAVTKMRELVLELAVRGQLSERHVEDQNDAAWRAFLQELKNRTYDSRAGSPPPFGIPDEWHWVHIHEVADAYGQKKPDEPFTYIDVSSIDNERGLIKTDIETVSPEHAPSRARKLARSGMVIYATVRPYLKNIAVVDREFSPPAIVSTAFAVLNPKAFVEARYLFHWLRSKSFEFEVAKRMKGVAYPAINDAEFRRCPIPLPPPAEQKRIAAKLDELMELCDLLEAQQRERDTLQAALARASLARFAKAPSTANLNFLTHKSYALSPADLRKSILNLAVHGKLVPQNPTDEPAEDLIAAIASDVATAIRKKRMRNSKNASTFGDAPPFDLPVGWAWVPLGALTKAEDGAMCDGPFGSKLKTEHYISTKGHAVLRLGNIGPGYFIPGKEGYISREHFESLASNHVLPGDLLVAGLADPLVRCCEVPQDIGPAVNKSDCFRVRISDRVDRSYVRHYLNSPIAKEFAAEENHGMTRERINLAGAKALPVSLPPLAEQRRIVAKVDELFALVDTLETQLTAARSTASKLLAAAVSELTATGEAVEA